MNMSKLKNQSSVDASKEFRKPPDPAFPRKAAKSASNVNVMTTGSCGDLTKQQLKHSPSMISREDSVSSKSSFSSLFPNIMRSFDNSSSFTLNQSCVPRPEKTMALFDIITTTLKDLYQKYAALTSNGAGAECSEKGEMCSKVDSRLMLIQSLHEDYQSMIQEKQAELEQIRGALVLVMSNTTEREELSTLDCERYWAICREMCLVEVKLERCCGKLQFQVMELEAVSRVNPLDQYELCIRLSDNSKFKTKIKVERSGRQIWDNTTFVSSPTVEGTMEVKFSELKTLNKSLLLLDKKVPHLNKLILPDTSIYSFWLTPMGTVKLKVIVQWNALLDDPDLGLLLSQIDSKYLDMTAKDGIVIRKRALSASTKNLHNRMSVNFSSMLRSDAFDRTSPRESMEDIPEYLVDDRKQDVNIRPIHIERKSVRAKGKYHDNAVSDCYPSLGAHLDSNIVEVDEAATVFSDAHNSDDTLELVIENSAEHRIDIEERCEQATEVIGSLVIVNTDSTESNQNDIDDSAVPRTEVGLSCLAREEGAPNNTVSDSMVHAKDLSTTSLLNSLMQRVTEPAITSLHNSHLFSDGDHLSTSVTKEHLIVTNIDGPPTTLTTCDNDNGARDAPVSSRINDPTISATANEKEAPINSSANEKEAPINSGANEKEASIPSSANEKETPIHSSANEKEAPIPPSANEKEGSIPPSANEKEGSIPPSANEKEASIPSSVNEKEALIPSSANEKEASIPPSANEKEAPIPSSANEKEGSIPPSANEKEASIPSSVNEKEASIPSSANEKEASIPPSANEKEASIPSSANEKEALIPSSANCPPIYSSDNVPTTSPSVHDHPITSSSGDVAEPPRSPEPSVSSKEEH